MYFDSAILILICKKNYLVPTILFNVLQTCLGMDMTVTAPLDMGTGQQRFVVAYTLKGVEKQPDILSAQKSLFDFYYAVRLVLMFHLK